MFDSSVDIRRALPRKTEGGVGSIRLNLFVSAGGNRPTAPVVRATSLADARQSRSAGAFCRRACTNFDPPMQNHEAPK
jgi:hypothetical protein